MQERIEWVDVYKGFVIILVVLGHASSPYNSYIYLFHMAAFFFISGFTTNLNRPFSLFLTQKVLSLIVPFFAVNGLFLGLWFLCSKLSISHIFFNGSIGLSNLKALFLTLSTPDIGGATWFLIVLFYTSILLYLINLARKVLNLRLWTVVILSILLLVYGYTLFRQHQTLPFLLDLALIAVFYMTIGYFLSQGDFGLQEFNHYYILPLSVLFLYFYAEITFKGVNWPTRVFVGNPIHHIVASFSGIYLSYFVAQLFCLSTGLKKLFMYIGRRSLSIILFHFIAFKIVFFLLYLLGYESFERLREIVPPSQNSYWMLLTIFAVSFSLALDWILRRFRFSSFLILGTREKRVVSTIYALFFEGRDESVSTHQRSSGRA